MATDAITVEGGLFAADLLERMAAEPDAIEGQKPAHFNQSGRLSEEIQSTFSAARRYWETFQSRRRRSRNGITTLTREHWARPLLEDLLGYRLTYQRAAVQVGGTSFPISHRAGDDPDAPPVHAVGIHHHLDRRADEEPRSPHALVQDYLNRTDPLWGVVTNCSRLRLLRGSARFARPTHVEFDLEAMVEQSLYSEFVFFYRLAHRTRLPKAAADAHECWLEKYYQQGIDEGGRVRERLRDGVKLALEAFGTGFLAHPANDWLRDALRNSRPSHQDYRQLLRLIYRLLFLMVPEERRLLLMPGHDNAARQSSRCTPAGTASRRFAPGPSATSRPIPSTTSGRG